MIIKNGFVFQENGTFEKKDLYVENGKIVSSIEEVTDTAEIDAQGMKVLPGAVDVHSQFPCFYYNSHYKLIQCMEAKLKELS